MLEAYYQESVEEDEEREDFILIGEDLTTGGDNPESKPIRFLTEFVLYDPKRGNELISLSKFEVKNLNNRRHFKAAGIVSPVFMNEEDAGQEDDEEQPVQRLRTMEVNRYYLDFTKIDEYGIYCPSSRHWSNICFL